MIVIIVVVKDCGFLGIVAMEGGRRAKSRRRLIFCYLLRIEVGGEDVGATPPLKQMRRVVILYSP